MMYSIYLEENPHVKKLSISVLRASLDIFAFDHNNRLVYFEAININENRELLDLVDEDNQFVETEVLDLIDYLEFDLMVNPKRDSEEPRPDNNETAV